LPPVSTTAMHIGCPMRVASAIAAFNTLSAFRRQASSCP
jgi:hypothetical protein